eukprot:scaffold1704_cov246-Pinguiococcus_pyrenoidosus.AAC.18
MSALRATAITSRPRPFPCAAPSMIPGRSSIWIRQSRYRMFPGMHVSVVNSYAAASLFVPVRVLRSDDLPTLGNPINATRPSPCLATLKPSPPP